MKRCICRLRAARNVLRFGLLGLGLLTITACATEFTGQAQYGGPRKCFTTCRQQNMEMAGYVFIGEYSSACVCEVRSKAGQAGRGAVLRSATAAVTGAAAGVVTQMRRAEAARNASR